MTARMRVKTSYVGPAWTGRKGQEKAGLDECWQKWGILSDNMARKTKSNPCLFR